MTLLIIAAIATFNTVYLAYATFKEINYLKESKAFLHAAFSMLLNRIHELEEKQKQSEGKQ